MKSISQKLLAVLCIFALLAGCTFSTPTTKTDSPPVVPYEVYNNNTPSFSAEEITTTAFESYSQLDALGRCGVATACIGQEIMPTEERGAIGQVKPSGWHTVKYDNVDGKYLYNRCHLIGFQLTGENANDRNLITGTRYMNTQGMLPFENQVADYVKETGNHVMYRVTPDFQGSNLLASGVMIEALSVEDGGKGIQFCVYCPNVQPDIVINYADGSSYYQKDDAPPPSSTPSYTGEKIAYVLNRSSKKFHLATCSAVNDIKDQNREDFTGDRQVVIDAGYSPCGTCNP